MQSPNELMVLFREAGKKVTPQRRRIFELLAGNEAHPTAENIHKLLVREMPTVSLKTVYQTLHELSELGEVEILDLGTGSARFDPNVDGVHHHTVCESCGGVRDVDLAVDLAVSFPQEMGDFRVSRAQVILRGQCGECMSKLSSVR